MIDWNVIIVGVMASIGPTAMGVAALRQSRITHNLVNSRMTELLELTKVAAKAEGKEEARVDDVPPTALPQEIK